MTWLAVAVVGWGACSVVAYGLFLGSAFHRFPMLTSYPVRRREWAAIESDAESLREARRTVQTDRSLSLLLSIVGPVGLIVALIAARPYRLRFRVSHLEDLGGAS